MEVCVVGGFDEVLLKKDVDMVVGKAVDEYEVGEVCRGGARTVIVVVVEVVVVVAEGFEFQ